MWPCVSEREISKGKLLPHLAQITILLLSCVMQREGGPVRKIVRDEEVGGSGGGGMVDGCWRRMVRHKV